MKWLRLLRLMPGISDAAEQLQIKGWYLSKTIWTNIITLAGSIVYVITGNDALTITGDEAAALSVGAVAVGNIILRILTDKPVGLRSVPGPTGSGTEAAE